MKAKITDVVDLVSRHFDLVVKGKKVNYIKGEFDAYEMIAKGKATLDVITRPALNKNQKEEIVQMIKEL